MVRVLPLSGRVLVFFSPSCSTAKVLVLKILPHAYREFSVVCEAAGIFFSVLGMDDLDGNHAGWLATITSICSMCT